MNFFKNLVSEGTKESHRRWISVTVSAAICYGIIMVIHKYPNLIRGVLQDAMIFVAVMSGVATITQIANIIASAKGKVSSSTSETTQTTEITSETTKTE